MDCTYKMVPPNSHNFKLMVLSGYNNSEKKLNYVYSHLYLMKRKILSLIQNIFNYLKNIYSFNPRNFMCDFALGQINALTKVFPNVSLHCCFFHFSQAIWNNFKKNQLCGKGTYETNYELLFNIQLLCFMKRDKLQKFFKELKKKYKDKKFKNFLNYFNITWMGKRYPINLWNFNDIINSDENKIKNFHFTNNLSENINRFLNSNLKRGICSNFLFRNSILSLIDQFDNKLINESKDIKKSSILTFYIKKNNNPSLLSKDEISSLYTTLYARIKTLLYI